VNQRGQTEYATGQTSIYTVDGWMIGWNTKLTVMEDGITLSSMAEGGVSYILQHAEECKAGTRTISVVADEKMYCTSGTGFISINEEIEVSVSDDLKNNISEVIIKPNGHKISAAKLELGPISTLALDLMQPYTPQDYQRELMECQRYFYMLKGGRGVAAAQGYRQAQNLCRLTFTLPTEMRTLPTIAITNIEGLFVICGAIHSIANANTNSMEGNLVSVNFTTETDPTNFYAILKDNEGAGISFSAEL